jgi:hypothetical protein
LHGLEKVFCVFTKNDKKKPIRKYLFIFHPKKYPKIILKLKRFINLLTKNEETN